jgi:CheY-like chemotaxis protein
MLEANQEKSVVLVVDDEAHILHVVSLKLGNAGYEIITAADGEEGLEKALEHKPDLVITDYQMPFLTGLELCEKLKANPATAELPAIMLTARGFSLTEDDLARTNIKAVLSKPFSPREVLKRVQEQLGHKAASEL